MDIFHRTIRWGALLKRARSKGNWGEVASVLRDSNYSSSRVEQFVAACEQYDVIYVDRDILSHCSSEQRDRLLETAVNICRGDGDHVERWNAVKILLQASNYSSSSVMEKFIAACEQYEVIHVDGEILSHCSSEQMDRLLKTALKPCRGKGRWSVVKGLLQDCNYSTSSVEIFIAACEQYSVIHVDHEILSHCSSEQKDRLLKTAVSIKRWGDVDSVLHDSNYSSNSVEIFIAACEQYNVIHVDDEILSHCNSQQKDRLLKTAVRISHWKEVDILLKEINYRSSSVKQFVTACEQYDVIHVDREILSHCSSEQRKRLFETAVKTKRWEGVNVLLGYSGYSSSVVEQFVRACEQHGVLHANKDLLSHCSSQQHGRLLETGVRNRRWCGVNDLLQYLHYSASFVEQFVTACERYGVVHDCPGYLSHCSTQQLDRLLTLAITLNRWVVVGRLLEAGGSHEKRVWAVEQACHASEGWRYILPHVDEDLLSHCNTQQLDTLLTTFVTGPIRNKWPIVGKVLKAGGSHEKRVWAIEQCTLSDVCFYEYMPHIYDDFLSQCSSQQLDRLLTKFTTKRQWQLVDEVLKVGGSLEKRLWVIQQGFCMYFSDTFSFDHYILPHVNHDLLSHCSTNQLDRLLEAATRQRRWEYVDKVLKVGGSTEKRVSVINNACVTVDHLKFQQYISPHCDDKLVGGVHSILTNKKCTVLSYAMLNEHCPRRMVAECIRLGFSTHEGRHLTSGHIFPSYLAEPITRTWMRGLDINTISVINASPFLLAVSHALPVVAHMLYESGTCSYPELLLLYTGLLDLSDPHSESGRDLQQGKYVHDSERRYSFPLYSERYDTFMNTLTTFLPYLREMASTPRSLESSCRLVISHCLRVGGRRERAVQELPLPEGLKDYLLFSDLTDPDYQPRMYKTMSAALPQQK